MIVKTGQMALMIFYSQVSQGVLLFVCYFNDSVGESCYFNQVTQKRANSTPKKAFYGELRAK